ncbi:hypothetical protein BURKHO8Y_240224 [Burkholderia sp. 8Y]|uniref:hypothetical protein n=1 Tax=Burkholderia sp. 8Y TaxID=2653133 RepID=UPI0012F3A764|nr:hypothetical protein [Burkholderia sp. 8Y]VXC60033.1 hypothetical protein BURKHO8Y_240224 [Burkholderia sp. 8Y]
MRQNENPKYITEWDGLSPLPAGATDAHLLEDADMPLSTDWDLAVENPPHAGYDGILPHPNRPKNER